MRVAEISFTRSVLWESMNADRLSMTVKIVLWLGAIAGLIFSVMSALNICTSACSEAALYTMFGLNFGWFGVIFFSLLIGMLVLLDRFVCAEKLIILFVCAAAGAELRFIWLQKYVIGHWCPLCLSIAAAIYLMAIVLLLNKWYTMRSRRTNMKTYMKYITAVMLAAVLGLTG